MDAKLAELDKVVFLCGLSELCKINNRVETYALCVELFHITKYLNRTCASIWYAPMGTAP